MYDLNIFVQGFPGKSATHGPLGWCTISLLSRGNEHIIVDAGGFSARSIIMNKLEKLGLQPSDITQVLLTHSHWDHSLNWTLFPHAEIVIGKVDMEWALEQPFGTKGLPEFYMQELNRSSRLRLVEHGESVSSGITVHQVAGHTPGHIAFYVENGDSDLIFSGDAAKNRAELLSQTVHSTLDEETSVQSLKYLWALWRRKAGTLMIPGHDIPMILKDGAPKYISKREASLEAWFGKELEDETVFTLNRDLEEK